MHELYAVKLIPLLDVQEDLEDPATNNLLLESLKEQSKVTVLGKASGKEFIHATSKSSSRTGYFVVVDEDDLIVFLCRYDTFKAQPIGEAVELSLVWRNPNSSLPKDFAINVMLTKLLSLKGTLVSDSEQTEAGNYLWRRALMRALGKHYLGVIDTSSGTLATIVTEAEVSAAVTSHIGRSDRYKKSRFVISKKPLKAS